MGLRLRRSFNLGGGVRLNVGKRGLGVSTGVPGLRFGIGPRGLRTTLSLPGTGLYYVKERRLGSGARRLAARVSKQLPAETPEQEPGARTPGEIPAGVAIGPSGRPVFPEEPLPRVGTLGFWLGILLLFVSPALGAAVLVLAGLRWLGNRASQDRLSIAAYNAGIGAHNRGDFEAALRHLEEALRHNPRNARALEVLASIHHDVRHDGGLARVYLTKLLEIEPDNFVAQLGLAELLCEDGEVERAIELCQKAQLPPAPYLEEQRAALLNRCLAERGKRAGVVAEPDSLPRLAPESAEPAREAKWPLPGLPVKEVVQAFRDLWERRGGPPPAKKASWQFRYPGWTKSIVLICDAQNTDRVELYLSYLADRFPDEVARAQSLILATVPKAHTTLTQFNVVVPNVGVYLGKAELQTLLEVVEAFWPGAASC